MASYGGIPTLSIAITITKSSDGDVVYVESTFRIDEEAGELVFEPYAITKLNQHHIHQNRGYQPHTNKSTKPQKAPIGTRGDDA